MPFDLPAFIAFVRSAQFRVTMAIFGGLGAILLGVALTHRFSWVYAGFGIVFGLLAAFVTQWVVRFITERW